MFNLIKNLTHANPTASAGPKITEFQPGNATVKCSQELETFLPVFSIGRGDGYTSLFDAASKSTPDGSDQIQINITDFSSLWGNHKFVVGKTEYKIPKEILDGCISGNGVGQTGFITLKANYDSNRKIIGYSLIRNGGQTKFTLRKSGSTFDLVTYEKEEQINGETFIREVINWKTSISGKCRDSSGNWHDAEVHGKFLFRNGNGVDNKNGKYFTNNSDGSKYVGEFKGGKRHGQGTLTRDDGSIYEGKFEDDEIHGQGTLTLKNGSTYVGEFNHGNMPTTGKLTKRNGSIYEGELKNGMKNGYGTFTRPDGSIYVGTRTNDKANGQGTLTLKNGSKYVGAWKDDEAHGYGKFTWPDGSIYEGEFVDGEIKPDSNSKVTIKLKEDLAQEYRIKPDKNGSYPDVDYLVLESANKIPNLELIDDKYHGIQ